MQSTQEDNTLSNGEQPMGAYMRPLENADPHPDYACVGPQLSLTASHVGAPVIAASEADDAYDTLLACRYAFIMANERSLVDGPATFTKDKATSATASEMPAAARATEICSAGLTILLPM